MRKLTQLALVMVLIGILGAVGWRALEEWGAVHQTERPGERLTTSFNGSGSAGLEADEASGQAETNQLPDQDTNALAEVRLESGEHAPEYRWPPPRYKLEVGRELTYDGSTGSTNEIFLRRIKEWTTYFLGSKDRTTYWVARTNEGGGWHIVAKNEHFFLSRSNEAASLRQDTIDVFDLFPDGRITGTLQDEVSRAARAVFPELPADTARARAGWQAQETGGNTSTYHLASGVLANARDWVFEKTEEDEIYESRARTRVHFDLGRGVVNKVESESTQGYEFHGTGTGLTELRYDLHNTGEWVIQLIREADILAPANAAVSEALESVRGGTIPPENLATAYKALREGRLRVELPVIVAQFDHQRGRIGDVTNHLAQRRQQDAKMLGKAAFEWETTDLEGKTYTLSGYRGQVVVLDFWFRGCGWCIRAMPQLKEVCDHYRGKPVAVLGMNTDAEQKDARFVAEKLKLNYPTLNAGGLPQKYGVRGFPTAIVIDQQGLVRERHVGYSANLKEELIGVIDDLLAERP